MDLKHASAQHAWQLINDPDFFQQWQKLYQLSDYATPYQAPDYIKLWYQHYAHSYTPLIVYLPEHDQVQAIMCLAVRNQHIIAAGSHQAEYQGWLCQQQNTAVFFQKLLDLLDHHYAEHALQLKYLPAELFTDQLQHIINNDRILLTSHQLPLNTLDPAAIAQSLKKKSNKSRINRLKKQGTLHFARVTKPDEQIALLKQMIPLYDFRQGAANQSFPFLDDHSKHDFHQALCQQQSHLLHMTGLWIDDKLVAAHLGFIHQHNVHLAIFCYSPFYSSHSPGKIHLLMLCELLAQEGMSCFDLTPGGDPWKNRFATTYDTVYELYRYRNQRDKQVATYLDKGLDHVKQGLAHFNITPGQAKETINKIRRAASPTLITKVKQHLLQDTELRIYQLTEDTASSLTEAPFKINHLDDLLKYIPCYNWQDRCRFTREALHRIEQGEIPYTYADHSTLLSYAWLIPNAKQAFFNEVQQGMSFPPQSAVLYDSYTHPPARGQGLHQLSLQQRIHDAFTVYQAKQLFIVVTANNKVSRHVIEKYGFEYIGSLYYHRRFNKEEKVNRLPSIYHSQPV
ncbi:GNAT family N-acetyltransferase [Zooshikella marina]|uniref:GNAT family N-acetyltransferase n=1 Tax=Zooshikella ganghwensis TaxID=202772 RepID=UPI001BAEC3BB|nr:GNAT family N-acetyltransferase [Zooshikella ganghwensis]MBU2704430.1 GNAT family N-acetyltransferase [Zooshikella ganghwensis]